MGGGRRVVPVLRPLRDCLSEHMSTIMHTDPLHCRAIGAKNEMCAALRTHGRAEICSPRRLLPCGRDYNLQQEKDR